MHLRDREPPAWRKCGVRRETISTRFGPEAETEGRLREAQAPRDDVDQEIELAQPNFTHLAPEEAAEAARLLAALIRAAPAQRPDSTFPLPLKSASRGNLADGSPSVPMDRGKAASRDDAGRRP